MTDKDLKLIETAKATNIMERINPEEADTEEAHEILNSIRANLYHEEEAMFGMI